MTIERFAGDRIIAHYRVTDLHALLAQLDHPGRGCCQ